MKNILNKKLNKKGFTLAELLIVVAIIAVLIAIAVPLFTGSLDRANKATFDANARAVKAAGVTYILENNIPSTTGKYTITGTLDKDGNITKVTAVEASASDTGDTYEGTRTDKWKPGEDGKTIIVVIEDTDLSA